MAASQQMLLGAAGVAPPATDPYFANVGLLLHFDGTNGSTTFLDSSTNAFTVTALGDAQLSTTGPKYGMACGLFDGTGDRLSVPDDAAWAFGLGDFTIEAWYYATTTPAGSAFVGQWLNGGNLGWLFCHTDSAQGGYTGGTDSKLRFVASSDGNYNSTTADYWAGGAGSDVTLNAWNHIAVSRIGTSLFFFLNGALLTSNALPGQGSIGLSLFNSTDPLAVGGPYNYIAGRLDELRITKGVARYTSSFTPPVAPYPNS